MSITNGTVDFTRRVTTGDYQHKEAKVSLSFENEDEAGIKRISQMTVDRALTMVGEQPKPIPATVIEQKIENAQAEKTWEGPKVGEPVRGVVDIMGVTANPTVIAAQPAVAAVPPEAPASVVITDKRLNEEVSAKNATLITAAGADDTLRQLATQKVLKLVDEFTQLPPGPGRLSKVPAEKRTEFLERLGALT